MSHANLESLLTKKNAAKSLYSRLGNRIEASDLRKVVKFWSTDHYPEVYYLFFIDNLELVESIEDDSLLYVHQLVLSWIREVNPDDIRKGSIDERVQRSLNTDIQMFISGNDFPLDYDVRNFGDATSGYSLEDILIGVISRDADLETNVVDKANMLLKALTSEV